MLLLLTSFSNKSRYYIQPIKSNQHQFVLSNANTSSTKKVVRVVKTIAKANTLSNSLTTLQGNIEISLENL